MNLEEGEVVVKTVRRHYLVLLPMFLIVVLAAILPEIIYIFIVSDLIPWSPELREGIINFVKEWRTFGYSLWLLVLWAFFFIEWTDYYLDLWLITNHRIIDVEQKGFFHRVVTSFKYKDIQNITVRTKGFIETFFKFGDLHIQTAGHSEEIVIKNADNPEEARSAILQMQSKVV